MFQIRTLFRSVKTRIANFQSKNKCYIWHLHCRNYLYKTILKISFILNGIMRKEQNMTIREKNAPGKWTEIKFDLQKSWTKLTDDELDLTKGNMKSISGLVQQRYGGVQNSYTKKISDIFKRFENKIKVPDSHIKKN
jgi:uncharacterized protein YjbJ (UPF0337 family)